MRKLILCLCLCATLLALGLLSRPAFAMNRKAPDAALTPVPATSWDAFDKENARIQTLMQQHVSPPGTPVSQASRDMAAYYVDARLAKDNSNLAAFEAAKANWLTAVKSLCTATPLPCGTVNPDAPPAR